MTSSSPNIRTCQIIATALMMGVTIFGVIALSAHLGKAVAVEEAKEQDSGNDQVEQPQTIPVLLFVTFCFTGGVLIGRFVILGVLDRQVLNEFNRERDTPLRTEDCLGKYQNRLIISLALLEGPAFFALITFMSQSRWEAFCLAVFLLLMMAINFPTETKFNHWVETARLNSRTTRGE
jgi:hypothetical protein